MSLRKHLTAYKITTRNLNWFGWCLALGVLWSCVSPFEIEVIGEASAIVVDASLTNEQKAHLVQLSYSERLDSSTFTPVTNATVNFIASGERIPLHEALPGSYLTDSAFAGIPGQTYQLEISLSDGQQYLSTEEVLLPAIPIDSIYARYIIVPSDVNETDLNGIQIFLDAQSAATQPHNFRYAYRESYAVDVPYPSKYDHRGRGANFEIFERERPLDRCYRKRQQSRTLISSTRNLTENRISEYPIQFINQSAQDLAYAYRIGVRQYTISDDAYDFFRQLRDINESAGTLSDRQLGSLTGNISGVGNARLPVLGYFEVAGVSEVRRTFSYHEFIDEGITTEEWVCPLDSIASLCVVDYEIPVQVLFSEEAFRVERGGDTVYYTNYYYDYQGLDGRLNGGQCEGEFRITDIIGEYAYIAWKYCSDCTWHGLYDVPEVWDD